MLPPALGFTGRNRRPPRDPANAALSLAYAILHREACACAFGVGLDPWIGFLHEPAFGRESLACDLVELARHHAEHAVWRAFRDRRLKVEHFSHDGGACLLGKAGRAAFYTDLEAWLAPARRRLRAHARLLVRFLRERCPERFTAGDEEAF